MEKLLKETLFYKDYIGWPFISIYSIPVPFERRNIIFILHSILSLRTSKSVLRIDPRHWTNGRFEAL